MAPGQRLAGLCPGRWQKESGLGQRLPPALPKPQGYGRARGGGHHRKLRQLQARALRCPSRTPAAAGTQVSLRQSTQGRTRSALMSAQAPRPQSRAVGTAPSGLKPTKSQGLRALHTDTCLPPGACRRVPDAAHAEMRTWGPAPGRRPRQPDPTTAPLRAPRTTPARRSGRGLGGGGPGPAHLPGHVLCCLRTEFLFPLNVIGFGLFIQISLQKCGNGAFSHVFPRKQTKCKRPEGAKNIPRFPACRSHSPPRPRSWDASAPAQQPAAAGGRRLARGV